MINIIFIKKIENIFYLYRYYHTFNKYLYTKISLNIHDNINTMEVQLVEYRRDKKQKNMILLEFEFRWNLI